MESVAKNNGVLDLDQDANAKYRAQNFLRLLLQTTSPLPELVRLALEIQLNTRIASDLPKVAAYDSLRDSVVTVKTLSSVLARIDLNTNSLALGKSLAPHRMADGFHGSAPFWVSASPWTATTSSDFVVSHLVSTFLALVNGYWRFVEQDVFLRAMRSGKPSVYCSPLLVNAILACASVSNHTCGDRSTLT